MRVNTAVVQPWLPDGFRETVNYSMLEMHVFNTLEELLDADVAFELILFHSQNENIALEDIKRIRASKHYLARIELFESDDGKLQKTVNEIGLIQQRKQKSSHFMAQSQAERLWHFLYIWDVELTVTKSPLASRYYFYPLLQAFSLERDYEQLIREWCKEKKIEPTGFVASYFACKSCLASQLCFTDHCPECHSQNLTSSDFLHCFSCGNIAPEDHFMQSDQLICKQCKAKLRHIGIDYDRALENEICNDCGAVFQQSHLSAECMHCETIQETDELVKCSVYQYRLTKEAGMQLSEFSKYDAMFHKTDHYIKPIFYCRFLEWGLDMKDIHPAYEYALLSVRLTQAASLFEKSELNRLVKMLVSNLRKTDMFTYIEPDMIWILLPNTQADDAFIVQNRIDDILNRERLTSHVKELRTFNSSFIKTWVQDGEVILDKLQNTH
ncbi:hypothetical protein [Fangia hongkongensis]|uniref:TackOD1 domain-containing metal-binding protein n=1 Tax=Fangia hongkongensis TaxID=270495 RepID=UPI00036A7B41|nr:hypothetical protein [Fangia hongkongensis]MBK2125841.1 hypothetical protein [Fangia hongkongensis]